MRQVTSRLKHRLQLGASIIASISAVCIVSKVLTHATRPAPKPIPQVQYIPAIPPPPVQPVVPKVIAPIITSPHLTPAFSAALREGDLKAMEAAYTDESSLDVALKAAAADGKKDVVKWVLDKGADVHSSELEIDAPVLQADAHADVVKLLFDRGASEAELETAINAGAPNAVGRILAKDKNAAHPADGAPLVTALNSSVASEENRRLIVEKLLAAGADPNEGDPLGIALARCAEDAEACLPITKLLLARHPDVSGEALGAVIDLGDTPTRTKLLDTLLSGKLAPSATATAISHLDGDSDAVLAKRLASRGVAWTFHDGENDAVAPLVDAVEKQDVALVRLMLDSGAPADYHFKDGRCALGQAIEAAASQTGEAERIVELLVARGANTNRRLPDGRPPLFAAAESGDVRVVKAIVNAGARVNERVLDETALDAAERSGHTAVARVLDGHGARRAPPRQDDR